MSFPYYPTDVLPKDVQKKVQDTINIFDDTSVVTALAACGLAMIACELEADEYGAIDHPSGNQTFIYKKACASRLEWLKLAKDMIEENKQ